MRELLERMTHLKADHDPDAWPAVQMRELTRLMDAIDYYKADNVRLAGSLEEIERASRSILGELANSAKKNRLEQAISDARIVLYPEDTPGMR